MKILIAEADPIAQRLLQGALNILGHDLFVAQDGVEVWNEISSERDYPLVILDANLSQLTGLEICRRIRAELTIKPVYVMLLTGGSDRESLLEGLKAGANDYLTKPFDPAELRARVKVACDFMAVQRACADRAVRFERALEQIKRLEGILPICSHCKSIRDEANEWHRLEDFILDQTDAVCSHGICPMCLAANLTLQAATRFSVDEKPLAA